MILNHFRFEPFKYTMINISLVQKKKKQEKKKKPQYSNMLAWYVGLQAVKVIKSNKLESHTMINDS